MLQNNYVIHNHLFTQTQNAYLATTIVLCQTLICNNKVTDG